MLSSRCVRCGAVGRDVLCATCVDYLIAYRPLWLDPGLLPGPSLLDLVATRDAAIVSSDLSTVEWSAPRSEPSTADAVRLVHFLRLDADARPVLSVGDAELLDAFLRAARRETPADAEVRDALVGLYRYLSTSDWMPPHLGSEYAMRANVLAPPGTPRVPAIVEPPAPLGGSIPAVEPPEEDLPEMPSMDLDDEELPALPAPVPFPPEPVPRPEPPLPLPEPFPEPIPEPEPEPEEPPRDATAHPEIEGMKEALAKERADVEAWVRSRSEALESKEVSLAEREEALRSKERDIEMRARAATERLVSLEKDEARRDVLRFLGTIPGMSEPEADVIATAFPDIASLRTADEKALTQCKGVSGTLARAIRHELVPGEVEGEQRATRLREEAQGFLEEGEYVAALDCYDRLLRERPEETGLWFDRAELLVLLDRSEEALACYTRVLDVDRGNRQAWFERANLLFGLGRLPDAIEALREVLTLEPAKAGDIVSKAEQLRRDHHPNEAAILYQAVLDFDPSDTRAILGLGDTILGLGDTNAAEALFTRALGKNPQNPPILFRKGELLERKGRWGAAIQFYNRAIALQWNLVGPWLSKARILLDHGRPREALECFDKVLSMNEDLVEAWTGKAGAHAVLGARDAAEAALRQGQALDPDDPAVRRAREAIDAAGRAAEPGPPTAPDAPLDFPSLAKAFEEIEEEPAEDAGPASPLLPSFVESIEPDEEETHVLLQLAELALEGGDADMALLRYGQAVTREPRNADAWTGKGVALQQLERYREALEAYDRALSLKPDHELARRWRATCVRHIDAEDGA